MNLHEHPDDFHDLQELTVKYMGMKAIGKQ